MCAAIAQSVGALPIEAVPLVHEREGQVVGCGVRLTGGNAQVPVSSWFDVSFNLFRGDIAVAQSTAYEIGRPELEIESRPGLMPVESTWILTTRSGSARRGENTERKDSLVYSLVSEDVLAVFEAIAKGEPITLGIKRWGEASDTIYTGTPTMQSRSRERIGTCLAALLSG